MNFSATASSSRKSPVPGRVTSALHRYSTPRSPQTPSLPGACPRSDRPRCGGRKSKFLAVRLFRRSCICFAVVLSLACLITSCVSPRKRGQERSNAQPPAANDWTTEYVGKGPVRTTVTNASTASLFLKVERDNATVAQVKIDGQGSRDVFLANGSYGVKLKMNTKAYRGPGFSIPPNTASIHLTLRTANTTNLLPISDAEFAR